MDTNKTKKPDKCSSQRSEGGYASSSLRDNYVAYCRYVGEGYSKAIETCDSDVIGAFKVYRESELERAYTDGQSYQAICELQGRDKFIESLKKKEV